MGDRFGMALREADPAAADRRIAVRLERVARGLVAGGFAVALVRGPRSAGWADALGAALGRCGGRLVRAAVSADRLHPRLCVPIGDGACASAVPVRSVLSGEPAPYVLLVADAASAAQRSIDALGEARRLAGGLRPMQGVLVVLVQPAETDVPARLHWLVGRPGIEAPIAADGSADGAAASDDCAPRAFAGRHDCIGPARIATASCDADSGTPADAACGWDEAPMLPLPGPGAGTAGADAARRADAAIAATVLRAEAPAERWIALAASLWLDGAPLDRVSGALTVAADLAAAGVRADFAVVGASVARAIASLTDDACPVDAALLARWEASATGVLDARAPAARVRAQVESRWAAWLASPDAADAGAGSWLAVARAVAQALGSVDWAQGLCLADRAGRGRWRQAARWCLVRLAVRLESAAAGPGSAAVPDHRVLALRAQADALRGAHRDAMSGFREAIDRAMARGQVSDAALIAQRAAFSAERAASLMTMPLLEEAHALQVRAGAAARAGYLARRWPAIRGVRDPLVEDPGSGTYPIGAGAMIEALQSIGAEVDAALVADTLVRQVMEHTACRYAALLLSVDGRLQTCARRAQSPERLVDDATGPDAGVTREVLAARAMQLRRTVSARETMPCAADASRQASSPAVCAAAIAVPVLAGGVCLGALYLETGDGRGELAAARRRLVELLAAQAANALANARLFEQLESSRRDLRQLNREIERKVIERTRQLEESYRREARLERLRAADRERERLVRELHDGMGSHLFAMVHAIEGGRFDASSLRESVLDCIADMRILLDAAGPDGGDLLNAWASFRVRATRQIESCGLRARWSLDCPHDVLELGAQAVLDVMRIAQEAITNAIRHSRASTVEIRLHSDASRIVLSVSDDGVGLADTLQGGRGLANMRARAALQGGTLDVVEHGPGLCIRLAVPYPEGSTEPPIPTVGRPMAACTEPRRYREGTRRDR